MLHIGFLLLGLGNGAVFAALALALVVTYRSSGVVNFATGAIALLAAYLYSFLRKGELFIPVPGFDRSVSIGGDPGLVPSIVIALVITALFGMLLYALVFRPLRNASPVAKAVASVGVLLIIQAALAAQVGTAAQSVAPILPRDVIEFAGIRIPQDRVWFAGIIVFVAVGLTLWFRFTRFGLATRAAAESEKGALVSGLSPERIAVVNWAISSAVAGLAGILIAPIVPVVPSAYTLFIVPALAAALVGNLTALGPAIGAALVIGMLQSELTYLQGVWDWLPASGTAQLVPLVILLVFLVLRGRPLPSRGAIVQRSLGRAPRPRNLIVPAVIATGVALIALLLTSGGTRAGVIFTLVYAFIGLSWVVVTGYAGQVSLAQLALAGVSAFALNRFAEAWGVPFPLAPLLAALVATLIGVVVGLPALRIRGLPVAIVTLALAVAVEGLWFRNPEWNGGLAGAPISAPTLFGLDFGIGEGDAYPRLSFGLLCLGLLLAAGLGVAVLRRSRLGAAMLAVRANERSAAAAGIPVARTKIIAFAIGSFLAGIGGALLGYGQTLATADAFTAIGGLGLFATVYIAGVTSLAGGIATGVLAPGGVLYTVLNDSFSLGHWYEIVAGIGLIVTVIAEPEGIVGPYHRLIDRLRARFARRPVSAPERHDESFLDEGEIVAEGADPLPATPATAAPPGDTILRIDAVSVRYGGVVAVDDVSFGVREGEIVGLIGPNGAGKTTLVDAVTGFTSATGRVELLGEDVSALTPHRRTWAGMGRTFQGIELYEDLSVEENVSVGQEAARHGGAHADWSQDEDYLARLFTVLKLDEVRRRPVGELSQGHRQLVSVARALAGRPKLILLDEPAGGLDSTESAWLGQRLRAVRDYGVTILLIDHDMSLVLEICDRVVVLDLGKVIADGPPAAIRTDPKVTQAYLGTSDTSDDRMVTR
ncbi:branched-chain amino acid ABC transporter permease/ATP-binding protein [Cryptosporangium aurantiacum]|uniref:Amino acid/amide ABC transporter membrane protein 1, HAAT family /amino acid/amide ABC transporter membrane protein 2, HAAT family /amino acid/amide ABC transporter ATP-binding protein 1, HAAT family n=1 Tax=Cryptosporangium aurantiacum TaxID=134849 RepID=A0A1M7R4A1_9ACTN|nr:branched-chain amino acid ABC transporter permease/ATP-binding protein [Cryptosporangium aurantiacum]SHN39914.1 amino acid/amide ABC transporter membrane protein 1, HAAT family /amino acid/amide ABC transporter membrane protein 2, HAAT family /amino acid/amide ABC transporter ATP-binding protein 1, HAAT family [Cryptosporangium aurantiacum]